MSPDLELAPCYCHICYSEILDPDNQRQRFYMEYETGVIQLLFISFFREGAGSAHGQALTLGTYSLKGAWWHLLVWSSCGGLGISQN